MGDVIHIIGLKQQPKYNGRLALVTNVKSHVDDGRVQVLTQTKRLALKLENIEKYSKRQDFKRKKYQVVMFWPLLSSSVPIQKSSIFINALEDWPDCQSLEYDYLMDNHGFTNPKVLSGITSEGQEKADFIMFYDASNAHGRRNQLAHCIHDLLPAYEVRKGSGPLNGIYRGPCILVYDPIISNGIIQSPRNKLWSLENLREVLYFHTTKNAKEMYESHNDGMHRLFGGI